jgi:hypothetical protein
VRIPKGMYAAEPQILAVGPASLWIDFDLFPNSGQGPDTQTLLHYDAGRWTQIGVPHGWIFRSSNLTTDGHGGIWLALADQRVFGTEMYDYRNGHWSKGVVLAKRGRFTMITSIGRIPGTRMVWAAGYAGYTKGSPRSYGILYEYRR